MNPPRESKSPADIRATRASVALLRLLPLFLFIIPSAARRGVVRCGNELTDPSLVTLRHSSRVLDIWLISGWHWAHLSLHGNSVRPCFRFGAPSGPLLGRPLRTLFSRRLAREWACLPVLLLSYFRQDSSPMLPCLTPAGLSTSRCLALSPPPPPPFPPPSLPAGQTSTSGRFSKPAGEPARAPMQEQGGQPDRLVLPPATYHSLV